jgi:ATP-dependent DNA helicase RecG
MKSRTSSTSEIQWNSPLDLLVSSKKPSPTLEKMKDAGLLVVEDLLWILPLRINQMPTLQPFREAQLDQYFLGEGKVIHVDIKMAFGRRGKGNIMLYNGNVIVKDVHSNETLSLRWFNLYPNQKKQIEALENIRFLGQVQEFKAQKQVVNPQILNTESASLSPYIIEYPTLNKVGGSHLKKFIDLIPSPLWANIKETLPELGYNKEMTLSEAFRIMHGRIPPSEFSGEKKNKAEERLIYEEFLSDQLKIKTRRKFIKRKDAPKFSITTDAQQKLTSSLPFALTDDQLKVFEDIKKDLQSGHPMMRMVQGDVGCGKTIVAWLAIRVINAAGAQAALMCPTEALANQHYQSFRELNPELRISLLLGSTKAKDKKEILKKLLSGETELIIGTHSLFQDTVLFKNLGLAIIDEQHKFGVEQRLRLVSKGDGTHSLIMTATPIPRTLSLAQYGDLDISSIRTMPAGRKGIKTRITEKTNYEKYIEFVKGRLSLGDQAYFVFPAIDESETLDIQNVKEAFKTYARAFGGYKVAMLHGQMKSDEKELVVQDFRNKKYHVLISTSVIEVGINIPNATVMSIYNPERFGLSSLHQLRGRVGRGDKGGFCFLVLDRVLDPLVMERLKVIENSTDGFVIAEEDLRFRGEGDLFGVDQSGTVTTKRLANFLLHTPILERVVKDLEMLEVEKPQLLEPIFEKLAKDQKILDTI